MTTQPVSRARVDLLRTIPELGQCTDAELQGLASRLDELTVDEGTVLIGVPGASSEPLVIIDGWAAVTVHGEPVAAVGPGQGVTDANLAPYDRHAVQVVAKTPVRALVVRDTPSAEA